MRRTLALLLSECLLITAGRDGWEATSLQIPSANGTLIVLKRPR